MGFHSGRVGVCGWCCMVGTLTDADVDGFVGHIQDFGSRLVTGALVLDIAHDISLPTALQRKRIIDAVDSIPSKDRLGGHAVVTNSSVAGGVLKVVNWFVKTSFPEKVFDSPADGIAWLAEMNPRLDVKALREALHANVPGFGALRW